MSWRWLAPGFFQIDLDVGADLMGGRLVHVMPEYRAVTGPLHPLRWIALDGTVCACSLGVIQSPKIMAPPGAIIRQLETRYTLIRLLPLDYQWNLPSR